MSKLKAFFVFAVCLMPFCADAVECREWDRYFENDAVITCGGRDDSFTHAESQTAWIVSQFAGGSAIFQSVYGYGSGGPSRKMYGYATSGSPTSLYGYRTDGGKLIFR